MVADEKLTKAEEEVLHLITEETQTIKQVAIVRNCSRQAVYKILQSLKKKGAYNLSLQKVDKGSPTQGVGVNLSTIKKNNQVRLHGQELSLQILWQDNRYEKIRRQANLTALDGNTIRLYPRVIEVYSTKSFFANDSQLAEKKSLDYWHKFIIQLEHAFKVLIIKPKSTKIRIVNAHYARGNSELAKSSLERKDRIWITAAEDGKLCFITDDSFGFNEDETVHPITAKPDRKAIDKLINDIRLNPDFIPPSKMTSMLGEVIRIQESITKNQVIFDKNMASHIDAVKKLGSAVGELAKLIREKKAI